MLADKEGFSLAFDSPSVSKVMHWLRMAGCCCGTRLDGAVTSSVIQLWTNRQLFKSETDSPPTDNFPLGYFRHNGTNKFERGLSRLLHTDLRWLHVRERVMYKLGVMVFSCVHGQAPQHLLDVCLPVSDVVSRRHLRRLLNVPQHMRSTFSRRTFSVAGSLVWNSLPDYTWETRQSAETLSASTWRRFCLRFTDTYSALEVLRLCVLQIHDLLTYLFIYHTVLPATQTFIHKWSEPSCLYSQAAEHHRTLVGTRFPSHWG